LWDATSPPPRSTKAYGDGTESAPRRAGYLDSVLDVASWRIVGFPIRTTATPWRSRSVAPQTRSPGSSCTTDSRYERACCPRGFLTRNSDRWALGEAVPGDLRDPAHHRG
jgi:hypothetical protein